MSSGGDSYRFPPRRPGGEPEEDPPPARPVAALVALVSGVVCVAALVVVEAADSSLAKLVATASLALAVLSAGIALLNGERRDGRARALALGGAGIAVLASVLSATIDFRHESPALRAADGSIRSAGSVPFAEARVGDCFRTPPRSDDGSLHGVPCATAHRGEVVAEVDLTDQAQVELDASFQVARQRCEDALRSAVRTSDPAVASASLLVIPSPRKDQLTGLCTVVTRADRTGSVRS